MLKEMESFPTEAILIKGQLQDRLLQAQEEDILIETQVTMIGIRTADPLE